MPDRKLWSGRTPIGRIAYVNGRYLPHSSASVHVEDRALQLGDGVYEVFNVRARKLIDEAEHLDRLERSLRELGITPPMARGPMAQVMGEVVRRNRLADGLLYLQVTRGAARRDHVPPKEDLRATLIITMRGQDIAALEKRMAVGIAVATQPDLRWARRDIKTVQLLPNLLAKIEAKKHGAFEAWLVDQDGFVTEGASTNAWIVDFAGDVVTRELSHAILPGVTRRVILEAAREADFTVRERKFTVAEAKAAREAFVSSATGVALPVIMIDGDLIGDGRPGQLTRRIHELYARKAGIKT